MSVDKFGQSGTEFSTDSGLSLAYVNNGLSIRSWLYYNHRVSEKTVVRRLSQRSGLSSGGSSPLSCHHNISSEVRGLCALQVRVMLELPESLLGELKGMKLVELTDRGLDELQARLVVTRKGLVKRGLGELKGKCVKLQAIEIDEAVLVELNGRVIPKCPSVTNSFTQTSLSSSSSRQAFSAFFSMAADFLSVSRLSMVFKEVATVHSAIQKGLGTPSAIAVTLFTNLVVEKMNKTKLTCQSLVQKPLIQMVFSDCVVGHTNRNILQNHQPGFALGDTVQSMTKGIWVWCILHPDKTDTVLMLLDTEGLGDPGKGDANHDNRIFTLVTLLCGTLVYNMKGAFDQDAVNKLTYPLIINV
ncbi:GBP6-like protein [Mya arenaria]|uniref:GBP6-like protein n=1 Tax=Mya arenaria TaxID=6604 RepID=A0ABY7EZ65_MYAAR|nr:GBP6-like protein [Mya arenaria]